MLADVQRLQHEAAVLREQLHTAQQRHGITLQRGRGRGRGRGREGERERERERERESPGRPQAPRRYAPPPYLRRRGTESCRRRGQTVCPGGPPSQASPRKNYLVDFEDFNGPPDQSDEQGDEPYEAFTVIKVVISARRETVRDHESRV